MAGDSDENGWTPPIERIGRDLDRIDDQHTVSALRTSAYSINEVRGDLMAALHRLTRTADERLAAMEAQHRAQRNLLRGVLLALLGLVGVLVTLAVILGQATAS